MFAMVSRSGEGGGGDAGAVELDELPDHAVAAEHLGDGEDEVGGGGALGQLAVQPEADDAREQHRQGLAEHDGLGLDAADPPAQHAEAVDHRGVGVGAQAHVREGPALLGLDHAGQVLDVDLVHDPGAGRDDREVVAGLLPPLEEPVALSVAAVLDLDVAGEGVRVPKTSAMTEWSMTSSAGISGLTVAGSSPRSAIACRIAARSTSVGTPLVSCRKTRDGLRSTAAVWSGAVTQPRQHSDLVRR